ncbi:hypothetical protein MA6G0728R_5361 [Mycobacteroides abscessus 6G-0728-R]|nr:hypothetical protein MA6G0125S_5401 [Mycobacteroides abscessus 6G-0125-S]EIU64216.1 hypothetical protein MA6G0728S_5333 [Mycobacteroides abscessus 6G-0728-S]EIU74756.1 hypothetical protein MA6G1108_5404 [Mycobacteroides abscessus 6G-1108]EIV03081.1 hypothetical protein MA6G0728R_5361 [Mycobacteroides abscessus 6G-0728-R]
MQDLVMPRSTVRSATRRRCIDVGERAVCTAAVADTHPLPPVIPVDLASARVSPSHK